MNIEDIKQELAKLEPEVEAAWKRLKDAELLYAAEREKWHPLYVRKQEFECVLRVIEESKGV